MNRDLALSSFSNHNAIIAELVGNSRISFGVNLNFNRSAFGRLIGVLDCAVDLATKGWRGNECQREQKESNCYHQFWVWREDMVARGTLSILNDASWSSVLVIHTELDIFD